MPLLLETFYYTYPDALALHRMPCLPRAKSAAVDTLSEGKAHFSITKISKQLMVPKDKTANGLPTATTIVADVWAGAERGIRTERLGVLVLSKEEYSIRLPGWLAFVNVVRYMTQKNNACSRDIASRYF